MKQKLLLICALAVSGFVAKAQDSIKVTSDAPLVVSGSVDAYYKYDFAGKKIANIPTSFASDQNSFSLGMVDLGLKKKTGKASFVGELSFGPRSDASIPTAGFHIQNLYMSYDLTDKLNVTGGYMSTFVGYEVISPVGNFNYSTSYLFTNGPFQNEGLKFTYTFSDKASLMAGIFNDAWNNYTSTNDVSTFGAQLMLVPVKNWTAYINLLTGYFSGTELDLTTTYQATSAFKIGLNAATFSQPSYKNSPVSGNGGFSGIALYPQYAVSKDVTLGLRGEYFTAKSGTSASPYSGIAPGESVTAITATANIKAGALTLIPELRLDDASKSIFTNSSYNATTSASQFVLAAVYAF